MRLLSASLPLVLLLACENTTVPFDDSGSTNTNPDDTNTDSGDSGVVAGSISVAPPSIDIGTIFVGQTGTGAVTVTNIGEGPIQVTLSVVGGHADAWTLDAYTSAADPGETTTHTGTLTPTDWGDYSVSVIVDDAISGGHVEVPVTAHVQIDDDRDGFGSLLSGGADCDDADAAVNPGASEVWYDGIDSNCDGANDYDQDGDGYNVGQDCDDTNASAYPGGTEVWYDGVDGNCDGADDYDQDADGHDDAAYGGDDCNDLDASIHPGAADAWYDGVDSNCDGANDFDQDGDGVEVSTDCDDTNASAYPGAPEVWYDGVDEACDGGNDYDQDGDGYNVGDDCDDTDGTIFPGAPDAWYDGIDNDCAGNSDYDVDGDGYDDSAYGGTDCNDADAAINPGATEVWYDGVDQNCDGTDDDQDGDGYNVADDCDDTDASIHPGAADAWYDGVDSDCAGNDDFDQDGDGVDYPTDCNDTDATITGPTAETWNGIDDDCDGLVDDFSATDVASGILYGSSSSMALGNKGQIAMDNDVTGDSKGDLVLVASGYGYGYAWVLKGSDAAAANGNVGDYDTLVVSGEQYYTLTYVDGPFADVDSSGTNDTLLGGYYDAGTYYGLYGRVYEFDGGTTGSKAASSYNGRFTTGGYYAEGNSHGVGGDFDGDGVDDVAIGAQRFDYYSGGWGGGYDYDCGAIQVYSGTISGSYDYGDADDLIYGDADYDYLGVSLQAADVDGDGYVDILAGASGSDNGSSGGGAVFVIPGDAGLSWSSRVSSDAIVEIDGDTSSLGLGEDSLAHPGDVDGDGTLDVGLSSEDTGYVWLFAGSGLSGTVNVSSADWILSGTAGDLGSALNLDTDLDGDGNDDLLVGNDGEDSAASNAGAVYDFSYSTSWGSTLTTADASATFFGVAANDGFGSGLGGGVDLDGDGKEDVAAGASGVDTGASNGGAVYVIPGR